MDYLEKAREIFKNDIFATETTGIEILEARPGYSKCRFKIEKKHLNALSSVMGGAIFTLADFSFAVASNIGGDIVVTINSQISYLGTAKGDYLYSECKPIKSGHTTCLYMTEIKDEKGTLVAAVSITGFIKKRHDD